MKRHNKILGLCSLVGVAVLFVMTLRVPAPTELGMRFLGYTTNSVGLRSTMLCISNRTSRPIKVAGVEPNQPSCEIYYRLSVCSAATLSLTYRPPRRIFHRWWKG